MDKIVVEQFVGKRVVFLIKNDLGKVKTFEGEISIVGDTSFMFTDKFGTVRSNNFSDVLSMKVKEGDD